MSNFRTHSGSISFCFTENETAKLIDTIEVFDRDNQSERAEVQSFGEICAQVLRGLSILDDLLYFTGEKMRDLQEDAAEIAPINEEMPAAANLLIDRLSSIVEIVSHSREGIWAYRLAMSELVLTALPDDVLDQFFEAIPPDVIEYFISQDPDRSTLD